MRFVEVPPADQVCAVVIQDYNVYTISHQTREFLRAVEFIYWCNHAQILTHKVMPCVDCVTTAKLSSANPGMLARFRVKRTHQNRNYALL